MSGERIQAHLRAHGISISLGGAEDLAQAGLTIAYPATETEAYCDRGPCWMHLGHDGPCQQEGPEMRGVMWERRRERTPEEIRAIAAALYEDMRGRPIDTVAPSVADRWYGRVRAALRVARGQA